MLPPWGVLPSFGTLTRRSLPSLQGFVGVWLHLIFAAPERRLIDPPLEDAVITAFRSLGGDFTEIRDIVPSQVRLWRSSVALSAWTLQVYVGYEEAIAGALAPRFDRIEHDDPRPRLLGAHAMTSIPFALDHWVAADGAIDLPLLIEGHLRSLATVAPPVLQPSTTRRTA